MSDSRPQYGEYATPEEQRAAIREPLPQYDEQPQQLPPTVAPQPVPPMYSTQSPYPGAPVAQAATMPQPKGDRIATIILLTLGGLNVLFSAVGMLRINDMLPQVFEMMGVPRDIAAMQRSGSLGFWLATIMVVGFALTAWWAIRFMRSGKWSWWIPLVGFVVTMIAMSIVMGTALGSDPAFQYLVEHGMKMSKPL